jgi:hypothetical protein
VERIIETRAKTTMNRKNFMTASLVVVIVSDHHSSDGAIYIGENQTTSCQSEYLRARVLLPQEARSPKSSRMSFDPYLPALFKVIIQ